jgi:uncharacterized protein (DUF1499 family)
MRYNDPMEKSRFGWMSSVALLTAVIAVGLVSLAGPGYRAGWVGLATALQRMIFLGVVAGIGAVGLGLLALMINRGRARALAAIAVMLGAGASAVPLRLVQAGQTVPPIHDITTDTVTPPRFVEAAVLRRSLRVPNSLDYSDDVAAQQRTGYPEIQPVFLAVSPDEAYRRAMAVVTARGWEVLAGDDAAHRIEATDTTRWFGFKDDVAIRIAAIPNGGSRVDVRSVSRVGRSDIGTNARRVREFLADLQDRP